MQYCPNCGAPVEGRFCAKCGTQMAAATAGALGPTTPPPGTGYVPPAGTSYVPPPPVQSTGLDQNIAAALCYIPIVGLVFLILDPYKQNRTIRFHAWQSLLFFAGYIVLRIGLGIVWAVLSAVSGLWVLWGALMSLVGLLYLVGLIVMAIKAYQGSRLVIPVIGPMAERQAG